MTLMETASLMMLIRMTITMGYQIVESASQEILMRVATLTATVLAIIKILTETVTG